MSTTSTTAPVASIASQIRLVRGQNVLFDNDLAALYGVPTKVLLQAVKRNGARFPVDLMFQLDDSEWSALRSQSVTSDAGRGGRRYAPYAFSEQGVAMLSLVLHSAQAIAVNIEIVRTFVRVREVITSNKDLARRLEKLENSAELMSSKQLGFEQSTRAQLKQIFDAIRELMALPEPAKKHPIGFVTPDDGPADPKAADAGR